MVREPHVLRRVAALLPTSDPLCGPSAFTPHAGLHPDTRARVRLLGPCFKTGRSAPFASITNPPEMDSRARSDRARNGHRFPIPARGCRHGDACLALAGMGSFSSAPVMAGNWVRRWAHGREASPSGPQSNTRQPPLNMKPMLAAPMDRMHGSRQEMNTERRRVSAPRPCSPA